MQPILRLSQLWQDFQQVQVSVARLGDILNAPTEPVPQNLLTLPPPRGAIDLRGVTMRYRPEAQDALKNINLQIAAGEVIGFVGHSGSGKSSLAKVIQRLYSPQAGQVMLDGVDIAQLDPGWLRRQIGVVLQENLLFNRTIHENIALADPAMPRIVVMQAARLAGADEFIAQLPQGYDTMIEERGANLSGGQRQRVAIARALVTNPRILIFDEATSALDYESERIIQENMKAITRGRTVLIIAHRLAAVRPCHRIVGMNKGEIVEVGTHEELLRRRDSRLRQAVVDAGRREALMNERAAPPPTPEKPNRIEALRKLVQPAPSLSPVRGRDREFLPAALEILETPPAPLPVALMLTICAFFAAALAWSFFGRLDVHAVAPGKIETVSLSKVVQPFDNGKISAIDVANGQHVKAGQVLLELDPAEALADADAARDSHYENLAEIARRAYAIAVAKTPRHAGDRPTSAAKNFERAAIEAAILQAEAKIGFAADIPQDIRLRQRAVLAADLRELGDQLAALDKQIAQKEATSQRLNMSIAFEDQLMVTLNDRVKTRQEAIKLKVGTKINLYDAKEELQKSQVAARLRPGPAHRDRGRAQRVAQREVQVDLAIHRRQREQVGRRRAQGRRRQAVAGQGRRQTRAHQARRADRRRRPATRRHHHRASGDDGPGVARHHARRGPLQVEALVANGDIGFVKTRPAGGRQGRRLPVHPLRHAERQGGAHRAASGRRDRGQAGDRQCHRALQRGAAADERPRPAGELRLPRRHLARPDRDEGRRQRHPAQPRHDRHRRDQDRQPPRHRLPAVAARQGRLRSHA